MIISSCCKSVVDVIFDYYVCIKCGCPSRTIMLKNKEHIGHDDTRNAKQIEKVCHPT